MELSQNKPKKKIGRPRKKSKQQIKWEFEWGITCERQRHLIDVFSTGYCRVCHRAKYLEQEKNFINQLLNK